MKQLAQNVSFGGYEVQGPEGFAFSGANIGAIVGQSLDYVFAFAGVGLLLMIIASGFAMMTSAGDPKKLEQGKHRLTNAIIGFLIVFAAFWIVQLVGTMFGWESINTTFGS
ncbi:hypothetical protein KBC80_03400 [Candidatus Woesebacteria bacterium]|jgi:uncharacterized membrane protein|nr:hypothetical protein [Candidatus Woesebacteria bacterium]